MRKMIRVMFATMALSAALAGPAQALDDEPGSPSGGGGCTRCEYYDADPILRTVKAKCVPSGGIMGCGFKSCIVKFNLVTGSEFCELDDHRACKAEGGGGGGAVIG